MNRIKVIAAREWVWFFLIFVAVFVWAWVDLGTLKQFNKGVIGGILIVSGIAYFAALAIRLFIASVDVLIKQKRANKPD